MSRSATAPVRVVALTDEFGARRSRDEPQWLLDLRRECWEAFRALPMPGNKDEEWMRTDIRTFRLDKFAVPGVLADDAIAPPAQLTQGVELAGQATAVDSQPLSSWLDGRLTKRGVLFGSLDSLVRTHGDLLRPHLMTRAVDPRKDKFAALHGAFWTGGFALYVPKGVAVAEPFHMLSALSDGAVDFGHALVILEDGADATVLAETASDAEMSGGLHCGAIELIVGRGARLRYVNLQDWGRGVWHVAQQKALVDRDASI